MAISIRDAHEGDEEVIVALVRELARAEGETSPVSTADVSAYLSHPDSGALLAELDGEVVGLLTWFVRPGLFHGGLWGYIDELVVREPARWHGVGNALVSEIMRRFAAAGCHEAAVAATRGNDPAIRLYNKHGLVGDAVMLERHFF